MKSDPDINPLPKPSSFSDDEQMVARFVVGAIRSGGTMFEGRIYECHLSVVLRADLPPRGVWPWDLRLRDRRDPRDRTTLEVRSSAGSFSIDGGRDAHVWIFVKKATYAAGSPADGYFVAPNHRVVELRSTFGRLSVARAQEAFPAGGDDNVERLVKAASAAERRYRRAS